VTEKKGRWLSSGISRRVVSYKFTDVSEVFTASIIAMMMEATSSYETSATSAVLQRYNKLEDSHLHIYSRQNLKSRSKLEALRQVGLLQQHS
jgi:hypothetical protein